MRVANLTLTKRFGGHYYWSPYHALCSTPKTNGSCCVGHFIFGSGSRQLDSLAALYRLMQCTETFGSVPRQAVKSATLAEMFALKAVARKSWGSKLPRTKTEKKKIRGFKIYKWDNPEFLSKVTVQAAERGRVVDEKWHAICEARRLEKKKSEVAKPVEVERRATRLQPRVLPSPMQRLFSEPDGRVVGRARVWKAGDARRALFQGPLSLLDLLFDEEDCGEELTQEEKELWFSDDTLLYVLGDEKPVACLLVTEAACRDEVTGTPVDAVSWHLFHIAASDDAAALELLQAVRTDCQVPECRPCVALVASPSVDAELDAFYTELGFQRTYWRRMKSLAASFTFDTSEAVPFILPVTDSGPRVEFSTGDLVDFECDRAPGGRGVGVVVAVDPTQVKSFDVAFGWKKGHRKFSFEGLRLIDERSAPNYKRFEAFLSAESLEERSEFKATYDTVALHGDCSCWRSLDCLRTVQGSVSLAPPDALGRLHSTTSSQFLTFFGENCAVVERNGFKIVDGFAADLSRLPLPLATHAVVLPTTDDAASRRKLLDEHYIRVPPRQFFAWLGVDCSTPGCLIFVRPTRPCPWRFLPGELVVCHAPHYAPVLVVVLGPRLSTENAAKPLEVVDIETNCHWAVKQQWLKPLSEYPELHVPEPPYHPDCDCCLSGCNA